MFSPTIVNPTHECLKLDQDGHGIVAELLGANAGKCPHGARLVGEWTLAGAYAG
jgi:hypothetical protein